MALAVNSSAAPGAPVSGETTAAQRRPGTRNASASLSPSDVGAFSEALVSASAGGGTPEVGAPPDASGEGWGTDFKTGFMSAVESNPALQAHMAELEGVLDDWQNSLAFDAGAAAGTLEFLASATMKEVFSTPLAQPSLDEMRQETAFFKQLVNAPELVSYIQSHPREVGAALGLLYGQSVETIATSAPTAFGKGMAYGRMLTEGVYVMSQLALGVVMTARLAPAMVQAIKANGLFQRLFSIVRGAERAFPALPMPAIHVTAEVIGVGGKPLAVAAPRQFAAGAPAPKLLPAAPEPKLLPAAAAEPLAAEAEQTALAGRRFNPDESGVFRIGPNGPVPIERALPGDGTYGPLAPVEGGWTGPLMSMPAPLMSIVASASGNGDKPGQPIEPVGLPLPPQPTSGAGEPAARTSHDVPVPEPEAGDPSGLSAAREKALFIENVELPAQPADATVPLEITTPDGGTIALLHRTISIEKYSPEGSSIYDFGATINEDGRLYATMYKRDPKSCFTVEDFLHLAVKFHGEQNITKIAFEHDQGNSYEIREFKQAANALGYTHDTFLLTARNPQVIVSKPASLDLDTQTEKMKEIQTQFPNEEPANPGNVDDDKPYRALPEYSAIRDGLLSSIKAETYRRYANLDTEVKRVVAESSRKEAFEALEAIFDRIADKSIGISLYNERMYIENLDSILADLVPRVEVIAKNNASVEPVLTYMQQARWAVAHRLQKIDAKHPTHPLTGGNPEIIGGKPNSLDLDTKTKEIQTQFPNEESANPAHVDDDKLYRALPEYSAIRDDLLSVIEAETYSIYANLETEAARASAEALRKATSESLIDLVKRIGDKGEGISLYDAKRYFEGIHLILLDLVPRVEEIAKSNVSVEEVLTYMQQFREGVKNRLKDIEAKLPSGGRDPTIN